MMALSVFFHGRKNNRDSADKSTCLAADRSVEVTFKMGIRPSACLLS